MARTRYRDEVQADEENDVVQNANRSARRKATRRIIEKSLVEQTDDSNEEEDLLEGDILGLQESSLDDNSENENGLTAKEPPKARQPRSKKRKTTTREYHSPPRHLPPHERYFWDNKSGLNKTSDKVLPPNLLLNHDDYFAQRDSWVDPHQDARDFVLEWHQKAFHQWAFELRNEFNICFHGYGSKRAVIASFAQYLREEIDPTPAIIIINGFRPDITLLDILTTIASTIFPAQLKLPSVSATLLDLILETLDSKPPTSPIHLLINSIDALPLRKGAVTQSAFASLAAHPSIRLIASADVPNFLQLWDSSHRTRLRFLFHDCTTFAPYDAELDPVESVNELLGRSGRRLGGRDGIGFVLKSLPENARHLFRILVAEQIAAAADGEDVGSGLEYRVLFQKAREELVCSTEAQLNILLKEFYDHQIVERRDDAMGTERLLVPFRKDELESLLDDLVE
jgi:origin recognition complex subunit 2